MFEYIVIVILAVSLGLMNWRRRVWKQIAHSKIDEAMTNAMENIGEAMGKSLSGHMADDIAKRFGITQPQNDWPDEIGEK